MTAETSPAPCASPERTAPPRRRAIPPALVGVVLQNPRAAFATTRVRDEIALALELRGVASGTAKARVLEVAERIGVSALLDRNVSTLSAGEATLVAIAAAVVEQPALLLVDEPLADLDTAARGHVIAVLNALARDAGVCVIVAEHRAEPLVPVADSWWTIDGGALVPGAAPSAVARRRCPSDAGSASGARARADCHKPRGAPQGQRRWCATHP